MVYDDGLWNDIPCDFELPAVCEDPCVVGTDVDEDGFDACGADCDDGADCAACEVHDRGPHRCWVCDTPLPYLEAAETPPRRPERRGSDHQSSDRSRAQPVETQGATPRSSGACCSRLMSSPPVGREAGRRAAVGCTPAGRGDTSAGCVAASQSLGVGSSERTRAMREVQGSTAGSAAASSARCAAVPTSVAATRCHSVVPPGGHAASWIARKAVTSSPASDGTDGHTPGLATRTGGAPGFELPVGAPASAGAERPAGSRESIHPSALHWYRSCTTGGPDGCCAVDGDSTTGGLSLPESLRSTPGRPAARQLATTSANVSRDVSGVDSILHSLPEGARAMTLSSPPSPPDTSMACGDPTTCIDSESTRTVRGVVGVATTVGA